jgi:hypothetical protein
MMTAKRFKWLVLALIVLLVLFLIGPPAAWASGDDDRGPSVDVVTDVVTDVTTNVTGGDMVNQIAGDSYSSRAYGFSHSLGDVDINQCIVSKQTGSFIVSWQGYDYNAWCMGEVYDAKGLFKMGAMMRCDIPVIRSHFETDYDCLLANTVDQEIIESPAHLELYEQAARFEVLEDEHDEELERVQHKQAMLIERLDSYEQQLAQRPEPVYVQAEPRISEEQIEQAWQIIKGAKGEPEK